MLALALISKNVQILMLKTSWFANNLRLKFQKKAIHVVSPFFLSLQNDLLHLML